jgi:hypothetical protein
MTRNPHDPRSYCCFDPDQPAFKFVKNFTNKNTMSETIDITEPTSQLGKQA